MPFRDLRLTPRIVVLYLMCTAIFVLAIFALSRYPGQGYVYIVFSVISNILLYFGFRNNAIFFDTYIGIFFWLGFWLKLTVKIAFMEGLFNESVGNFDGSGAAFDLVLIVTSIGLFGLLVASVIREKLIFKYPSKIEDVTQKGLLGFYCSHRSLILLSFLVLIISVSASNIYLGIYQRGEIPRTILPYGLGGVYSWLLLFGLASFSALMLKFEFEINKRVSYLVILLGLLEGFFSSVSLLSRGMILNTSALLYGLFRNMKYIRIKTSYNHVVGLFIIFAILFVSSVFSVNYLRSKSLKSAPSTPATSASSSKTTPTPSNPITLVAGTPTSSVPGTQTTSGFPISTSRLRDIKGMTVPLFLDRWVGIEGVMAVSSYPKLGWDLWREAWKEVYSNYGTSFYDINLIKSPYLMVDTSDKHYISLPGILAFCYYPGSLIFLFGCMFLLSIIAAVIEASVFKFGGKNLILCSLFAQVVAFRFSSFGYVPARSYQLFGTLFLNLFIIYFADKCLLYWNTRKSTQITEKLSEVSG